MKGRGQQDAASAARHVLERYTSICLLAILAAMASTPFVLCEHLQGFPPVALTRYAVIESLWQHPDHDLAQDPAFLEYQNLISDLGELIAVADRRHDAIALIRRGREDFPQFTSTGNFLAVLLMRLGGEDNLREAQDLLEQAVESWNLDTMAQNNLGVILETQGRMEDAFECYQFAIEGLSQNCYMHASCIVNANKIFLNMARMQRRREDYRLAARSFQMAGRLYERISGCSYAAMHDVIRGAGDAHRCKDVAAARYSRSLEHFMRALQFEKEGNESSRTKHMGVARTYILQSLSLPDFFFDPPRQLLSQDDESLVRKLRFQSIFERKFWSPESESASGPGSNADMTGSVQELLYEVMSKLNTTSVLDVGCGDWFWMSRTNLSGVRYVGVDIVDKIIESNTAHAHQRAQECKEIGQALGCSLIPRTAHFRQQDVVQSLDSSLCLYQEDGEVKLGRELVFVKGKLPF